MHIKINNDLKNNLKGGKIMGRSLSLLLMGTVADLRIILGGRYALGTCFLGYSPSSQQQENGESSHCTESYHTGFILSAAPKKN